MFLTFWLIPAWFIASILALIYILVFRTERKWYTPAGEDKVNEGLVFYADPLMWALVFVPGILGLVMLSSIFLGYIWDAAIGAAIAMIALRIFLTNTKQTGPMTLGIRIWFGRPMFFRECMVIYIPYVKMIFERIDGLQDIQLTSKHNDPNRDNVLSSFMKMPIPEELADKIGGELPIQSIPQEISFSGTFTINIDIDRPISVLRMFLRDMQQHPHKHGSPLKDEWEARCRRIILPLIYAASDELLQTKEWTDTIDGNIAALNRELEQHLREKMERNFSVEVKNVFLSEAHGIPIEELRKQGQTIQLQKSRRIQAEATRDTDIAVAEAEAETITKSSQAQSKADQARANARLEAEKIVQTNEGEIETLRRGTLEKRKDSQRIYEEINQLALVAKLNAIVTNQAAFALHSIDGLSATEKSAVMSKAFEILKTESPDTLVNLGDSLLNAHGITALVNAVQQAMGMFSSPETPKKLATGSEGIPPTEPPKES